MKRIIILPFAEEDIKDSAKYYSEKEKDLDKQFLRVINQAFRLISDNPQSFPEVKMNIRMFVVKNFPFNIFYTVRNDSIFILAVFHMKRDPKRWKKRIKKSGAR